MAYAHKIREAMGDNEQRELFTGILAMDRTYISVKPRKDKESKNGRGTKKTPIVGITDRDNKKVYADVSHPNEKNQKLTSKQLLNILEKVADNNPVIRDEFRGYNIIDKDLRFFHEIISHRYEYSNGNIHTNSIESFLAFLKRNLSSCIREISAKICR